MRFSYATDRFTLLRDIDLPLSAGRVLLITGKETASLEILGGIIAKLIPITAHLDVPQIMALLHNYLGKLTLSGSLPQTVAYVSADPERHFLLATVEEEMAAQLGWQADFSGILATFGLTADFLTRRIPTLSGGEKMKVVLALAFAVKCECYVVHGVVPWLDRAGHKYLLERITQAQAQGASVVIIEQEFAALTSVINEVYIFDGATLHSTDAQQYFASALPSDRSLSRRGAGSETILHLQQLSFAFPQLSRRLLDQVTMQLILGKNYLLLGENGAGKSTIARLIFRVLKPEEGDILLHHHPIDEYPRTKLNHWICYVGQFPLHQITLSTIGEYREQLQGNSAAIGMHWLDKYLSLPDNYPVSSLSFLQLKILCLLTTLTKSTALVIFDEPTWGIDHEGRELLWELLCEVAKVLNFTLLIVTHDLTLVNIFHPEIFWLQNGKITHFQDAEQFLEAKT